MEQLKDTARPQAPASPPGSIAELHDRQARIWREENAHWLGLPVIPDWSDAGAVQATLADAAERYWNAGSNAMLELLRDGRCRGIENLVPGSWELVFDSVNWIICLYAKFQNGQLEKRSPVMYLPCPDTLCWYVNESRYALRVVAEPLNALLRAEGAEVTLPRVLHADLASNTLQRANGEPLQPAEALSLMDPINLQALRSWYGKPVHAGNLLEALACVPPSQHADAWRFAYYWVDALYRMLESSKRFANPLARVPVPINLVKMLMNLQTRARNADDRGESAALVLAPLGREVFALEASRTVVYRGDPNNRFLFTNAKCFFDAFKTTTSKAAGRTRLLLDTTQVRDGRLWTTVQDGLDTPWQVADQWQVQRMERPRIPTGISVLSSSPFASNNAAKRIMMTAKLRAQAVPVEGEVDPLTHEVLGRVVFGDWKGFNFGDSIIISRSFAHKLRSVKTRRIPLNLESWKAISSQYGVGDALPVQEVMRLMEGSASCDNLRNITITGINANYLTVQAEVPFSVGDKITNMHGSKGIVSLILEDEDMPQLLQRAGNLEPGPMEVIVSGLSVYRRKSFGQLFEAWYRAEGLRGLDNISEACKLYGNRMRAFAQNSLTRMQGEVTRKPLGLNAFIRLDHDAVTKEVRSVVKTNHARMLKLGEQEILNLAARGYVGILNELDLRSVSKHVNAIPLIRNLQLGDTVPQAGASGLRFFNLLHACGFDCNLNGNGDWLDPSAFGGAEWLMEDEPI